MRKLAIRILVVFVAASFTIAVGQKSRRPARTNQPPKIASFVSDTSFIYLCPWMAGTGSCSRSAGIITLSVDVCEPDGDPISYQCKTSAGTLSMCGRSMSWDLSKVANGIYTATVKVTDGRGGEDTAELQITIADCSSCDPPPPPCPRVPKVEVTCPETYVIGQRASFAAKIDGVDSSKIRYYWEVNWGQIISGQRTSKIEVEHNNHWGEKLTATVSAYVEGTDPSCQSPIGSCTSKIKE